MRRQRKVWNCIRKGIAGALAAVLAVTGLGIYPALNQKEAGASGVVNAQAATVAAAEFETAREAVDNMCLGWNLGNSMDSNGTWISSGASVTTFETAWGNPVTTQAMISSVKEQGFNAVRIPVTYAQHMDSAGNIDTAWLARVKEIVDYCYAEDMYCIINVHHDTGAGSYSWIKADTSVYASTEAKYQKMWTQIAEYFKSYDEKLLFEGYNEMLDSNNTWNNPQSTSGYTAVNNYAQAFVDAVRATGGNNATRNLVVNTYAGANNQAALNALKIPTDTVSNHIIMQVHSYDPSGFTSTTATWTTLSDTWTTEYEKEIDTIMLRLYNASVSKNVPIIIGEFGSEYKNNDVERGKHASYFVSKAKEYGITCFYWDNNCLSGDGEKFGIFDRRAMTWKTDVVEPMVAAANSYQADASLQSVALRNVSVSNAKTAVVTWTKSQDADIDGYLIYRREGKTGSYKLIAKADAASASYTDTSINGNNTYYYKVNSYKGNACSPDGTAMSTLGIPTVKNVDRVNANTYKIYWSTVAEATGYRVYRKENNGSWTYIASVTGQSASQYTDTVSKGGVTYSYTVRAYRTKNSVTAFSHYTSGMAVLGTVKIKNVISCSDTANQINWNTVSGATAYDIYRKLPGGSWTKLTTVSSGTTSYTDRTAKKGVRYIYTVRSVREKYSIRARGWYQSSSTTLTTPVLQSATALSKGSNQVKWTKVEGATSYRVYRKVPGGGWSCIGTVSATSGTTCTYNDTTAKSGVEYVYTVRALTTPSGSSGYTAMSWYQTGGKTCTTK